MCEFEDISSGFHDVFLSKYSDSSGPILDFYISDSMQDMLDIDIRSEVAINVGGVNEFSSLMSDLPQLDLETCSSNDGEISWYGRKWSAANDIYADVGACINPNSVHLLTPSSTSSSPSSSLSSASSPSSSTGNGTEQQTTTSSTTTTSNLTTSASSSLSLSKVQLNLNTNNYQLTSHSPLPSPKEKKSHLTFSPNTIKVPVVNDNKMTGIGIKSNHQHSLISQAQRANIESIKKDLNLDMKDEKTIKQLTQSSTNPSINVNNNSSSSSLLSTSSNIATSSALSASTTTTSSGTNTIKLAAGIGGLTFANSLMYAQLKQNNNNKNLSNNSSNSNNLKHQQQRDSSPQRIINTNNSSASSSSSSSVVTTNQTNNSPLVQVSRSIIVQNNKTNIITHILPSSSSSASSTNGNVQQQIHQQQKQQQQTTNSNKAAKVKPPISPFPKPAYSYSCLIALALKNSRAGLLPVSEIYSFMCEHFPHFETAPTGWKNSVRHNLSLNKCFKKIEKPATNGGQRKGCLWAMNPSKIVKMDDEIQKWSRKDPMAIRKAMVFPDNLEFLERGEMKHGSTGDSEGEGENEIENETVDEDTEDNNSDNEEQEPDTDGTIITTAELESADDEDDQNSQIDYDIEVSDLYDEIVINSPAPSAQPQQHNKSSILSTSSINLQQQQQLQLQQQQQQQQQQQKDLIEIDDDEMISSSTPKRARVNINYSIGPAGAFQSSLNGSQQHHSLQSQQIQSHHHQQNHHNHQHQQQHNIPHQQSSQQQQHHQQQQQQHQNRRKMTLVNRIVKMRATHLLKS